MEKILETEKLLIGWTFCLLYSVAEDMALVIQAILCLQFLITIIAYLIQSYKHYGTEKRKSSKPKTARGRSRQEW